MDYTVHGILQARVLEWVALPFSRGSSQPRYRTQVSHIAHAFFTSWATRDALSTMIPLKCPNAVFWTRWTITNSSLHSTLVVVQSCLTLQLHGLQLSRLPCPSSSPRACSNSCPSSQWCHPTISPSVVPFSSCLQSFPASGSFPVSQLFVSGGHKYWSFGISLSNEYSGLISFRIDWFDLLAVQGTLNSLLQHYSWKASVLWCSASFMVKLSNPYITTAKTIALTIWAFVGKVMSLLFDMPSTFVIAFLPRCKHLLVPRDHPLKCSFLISNKMNSQPSGFQGHFLWSIPLPRDKWCLQMIESPFASIIYPEWHVFADMFFWIDGEILKSDLILLICVSLAFSTVPCSHGNSWSVC